MNIQPYIIKINTNNDKKAPKTPQNIKQSILIILKKELDLKLLVLFQNPLYLIILIGILKKLQLKKVMIILNQLKNLLKIIILLKKMIYHLNVFMKYILILYRILIVKFQTINELL